MINLSIDLCEVSLSKEASQIKFFFVFFCFIFKSISYPVEALYIEKKKRKKIVSQAKLTIKNESSWQSQVKDEIGKYQKRIEIIFNSLNVYLFQR